MIHHGLKINKDKITDIFFTDMPMEKAEPLLHNAITNIRNALKTPGTDKKYIAYEGRLLSLNENYFYKSDAMEFNNLYKQIFSKDVNSAVKNEYINEAINLYKGEFLPGLPERRLSSRFQCETVSATRPE